MPILSASSVILPEGADLLGAQQVVVPVSDQTSGSMMTYTVSGLFYELITSAFVKLVTNGVAGNRLVVFIYTDASGNQTSEIPAGVAQPASGDVNYTGLLGLSSASSLLVNGSGVSVPLAPILLFPGDQFRIVTNSADAGDRFSLAQLVILRYPTGPVAVVPPATPAVATPTFV